MIKKLISIVITVFLGIALVAVFSPIIENMLSSTGLIEEKVMIAGTGSMYPTFPKGQGETDVIRAKEIVAWPKMRHFPGGIKIFNNTYFDYKIKHNDIVEFENKRTDEISKKKYEDLAGFVKRVVGIEGDTIELRDGFVIRNGLRLDESFTAKPRSTYGGDYLPDCQKITIPPGKLFVLGDNRKASLDSRFELGLVDIKDIRYVLPWEEQGEYKILWRDTKSDESLAGTATLNEEEFVTLLNEKRKEKKLKPFTYNQLLSLSSKRRGSIMLSTNDFSSEATKSGITLEKTVKETGYWNILFAEVFTRGFYEAQELLDNFMEFPETQKLLLSSQYQDIGVYASFGEVSNCPTQVVVAHLGGYVPPNYKSEEIESWQHLVDNLESVLPSWRNLKGTDGIDQEKLTRLLDLLDTRLANGKKIVSRMKANQWFTEEEKRMIETDDKNTQEVQKLTSELMRQ